MKTNLLSYKFFRTGAAWIILILGIGLYALGYFGISQNTVWKEIVIKFGDVLVIGVILGYLSNAAQFLGVFKSDLQDIIYGKEFIKQRKDLNSLWETLSKQLFKNKFPAIHKEFLKVVNNYFPEDEISYYNDYERNTTIEWHDKDNRIIKVTDVVSFDLIAETSDKFAYPIKTWTNTCNEAECQERITEFSVNKKKAEVKDVKTSNINGVICKEQEIELSGSTKYEIQYTREKIYNIDDDYYIGFRPKYIVNRLRLSLNLPDDIEAIFICRGTQLDFDDIATGSSKRIGKKYKGIILPRQGYIFVLHVK